MCTVDLARGGHLHVDGLASRNVLLYVVRGAIRIGDALATDWQLVEIAAHGDALRLVAEEDSVLLLGHADRIGEPVVAHGPFVMNTREEIAQAVRDYQAGKFDALPR
jgi:redox-sensitive bicupin YhaK (pirin superfamily)